MKYRYIVLVSLSILFALGSLSAQSLLDGFNRTNSNTVGNNWTELETAPDNAKIEGNTLRLVGTGSTGWEWVYQDVSPQYETTLSSNSGTITWAFNMRQSHLNPDGFGSGKYGMLFVLGASTNDRTTANGYGIAIGKSGGTHPIQLVRFTGGFDSDAKFTIVYESGDFQTYYTNVRITYNPTNDQWSLYAEDNPSSFTDPLDVSTLLGNATDNAHTGLDLRYFGGYYNHGAGADSAIFDNVYIPGAASPSTQVQFAASTGSVNEGAGTYSVEVTISNEDGTTATTADVVLTTAGSATNGQDISTYSTQQVTFPAGDNSSQFVDITINDDSDTEGTEDLVFELQNVAGGNSAQAGVPGSHTLNIIDNEIPKLMISEVADPQDNANAGFVELYNASGSVIDFASQTWYLSGQNDGRSSQWRDLQLTGTVNSGETFVVAVSQSAYTAAYGFAADMDGGTEMHNDGIDSYFLYYNGDHTTGTLVDAYGAVDQEGTDELWEYTDGHAERVTGVSGPNPTWTYTEWDVTLPATTTDVNPTDSQLPINLTLFQAFGGDRYVNLKWITASEINNLGYAILRAESEHGEFREIASYENSADLKGAGTTSNNSDYSFTDRDNLVNGTTYWYTLVDIDFNGNRTNHGPVKATPHAANMEVLENNIPADFHLGQNYPNPFNPSTNIEFVIPKIDDEQLVVSLNVFNLLGQKVFTLYDGKIAPGSYIMNWSGIDFSGAAVPSGVYIYELQTEYFTAHKKMLLVR